MAHINLLPWREQRRKEQTRDFIIITIASALIATAIVAGAHWHIDRLIHHQNVRNNILQTEIRKLDDDLKEIKDIESTKQQLLSRMEIIQSLQHKRPQIVHIFDELVRATPEGVYLTSIKQKGDLLTINGMAESNGRISAYMRNIDTSPWLADPRLEVIETNRKTRDKHSAFTLVIKQSQPEESEEDMP